MEYLIWVTVALLAYGALAPVTSEMTQTVPPALALFLSTAVFLALTVPVMVIEGSLRLALLTAPGVEYVYVGGLFLSVGILAYYYALQQGPVSVVVPIYGMFIVGSAVIGVLFLGEPLSLPASSDK
jgi:transporter family protein